MEVLHSQRHLQRTTAPQVAVFFVLVGIGSIAFFELFALPILHVVFRDSLDAQVWYLDRWFEWMLSVGANNGDRLYHEVESKVYLFNPMLSLLPVIVTVGFIVAAIVSALLPQPIGLVRKNLTREIANAVQELARRHFGLSASDSECKFLQQRIETASVEQLHVLAGDVNMPYDELLQLQRSLLWGRGGIRRIIHLGSALRLYLRNHFTVEYEQAVLGSIYVGAAVLIIIIGLRGLQFIPKERPSLVLFAISLEFVLLIAYAATLMFSHPDESTARAQDTRGSGELFLTLPMCGGPLAAFEHAEKLLRMFIAVPPPSRQGADDVTTPPQSHRRQQNE